MVRLVLVFLLLAKSGFTQMIIDTVAGAGNDDGIAAKISHAVIRASAFGPDGSIYFSSVYSVRRIKPDGILETLAGTGESGFSGDRGPALLARLRFPGKVIRDPTGNLLFTDNGRIRLIAVGGTIDTLAGNGLPILSGVASGPARDTPLDLEGSLAMDPKNNIYAISSVGCVVKVSPDGTVAPFAGTCGTGSFTKDAGDGGPAVSAQLALPVDVAVDSIGNVYVAEFFGTVRKIDGQGIISTVAGLAPNGRGAVVDGQSAVSSYFQGLSSMVFDQTDNLYLTGTNYLTGGSLVSYRIDTAGNVYNLPTVSGNVTAVDSDANVYFLDRSIAYKWKAGSPAQAITDRSYMAPDGADARSASIDPSAITVDGTDHLVFAERGTCLIRRVAANGTLETIAGTGKCGSVQSAGPAHSTGFTLVTTMTAVPDGTLYLGSGASLYRLTTGGYVSLINVGAGIIALAADVMGNVFSLSSQAIYRITPGGESTIFANLGGLYGSPFSAMDIDLTGVLHVHSLTMSFAYTITPDVQIAAYSTNAPNVVGAAFDRTGHEYLVSGRGELYLDSSLVGSPYGLSGDGGILQAAYFYNPSELASDSQSAIYMLDGGNSRIRKITQSLPVVAP